MGQHKSGQVSILYTTIILLDLSQQWAQPVN